MAKRFFEIGNEGTVSLGLTLIAFTHFIYDTSNKELVLADIQGGVKFQLIVEVLELRDMADCIVV